MTLRMKLAAALSPLLLAGCTLATDAGDRVIVDRLGLDFTLAGMSAHRTSQLDVALVVPLDPSAPRATAESLPAAMPKYRLRARARVVLPADTSDEATFPSVRVAFQRVIEDEPLDLLFYVDSQLDQQVTPLSGINREEHTWIRDVGPSGELGFYHEFKFENFYDSEIVPIGGDVVLDVPGALMSAARLACLRERLEQVMSASLEVRITFAPNAARTQVGSFKLHRGNDLPTQPVRLEGIADNGSVHGVEVFVDDSPTPLRRFSTEPASAGGLTIPFEQWFPLDEGVRTLCVGL